jgi:hypothetical protein
VSAALAQRPDFAAYVPRIEAARIAQEDAPKIDGDLSDPAWSQAFVVERFFQVQPVEGAQPSFSTRALVMYDERTLYVGFYSYDPEPKRIVRNVLERDARLQDEDAVRILIDSFGTFRDGYLFAMNANGARADALVENNSTVRPEWSTIWRGKAKIVEDGWIAEFAIPFRSISFDASLPEWNFQLIRVIRRTNEEVRWSNIDRSRERFDLTNPGRIAGIEDVSAGIGLEAQLFLTGSESYDWETGEFDTEIDPSANIFYKITPSLTGSLTFNTDFSDAPLDQRQVNTGRFSLFFPETRDFFLQDVPIFEFGGRIFQDEPNGLPFFTRRVGIVDGRPVDIVAGAKISGKFAGANVGLISARTGSSDVSDGQFLSAARLSVPVLAESKLGVTFTHGDPSGGSTNTVAGADFQYKNSTRWPGTLFVDVAHIESLDDGARGSMTALDSAYRSTKWNWTLRLQDIEADYRPRLGFANRTDIRLYSANAFRKFRPSGGFLREIESGLWVKTITDREDTVEDFFWGGWTVFQTDDGDEAGLEYENGFLDIREPFDIAGEVPVAAGKYHFDQYQVFVGTSRARPLAARSRVRWGGIYDGDFLEIDGGLLLQPSRHFNVSLEYLYTQFSLPSGSIGVHVAAVGSTIAISPDMSIRTDVQYDNISENFTFLSRFVWNPVPEREIFVSFGETAVIERDRFPQSFRAQGSNLSVRLGHTFRL